MRCKNYLLATVSSLAIVGAVNVAQAADLPARAPVPVKAPVVVAAAYNWTGFYIGVHGGGAWLDHKQDSSVGPTNICSCSLDKFGGAFGGLAGYNFQAGRVVYGIEADGSWLSAKATEVFPNLPGITGSLTANAKVDWLATVRGRIGITMSPTLLYVTGGVAFGGVEASWSDQTGTPNTVSIKKTKTGYVVGGGLEHAFAPNWLVRVEGLFHDLGKDTATTVSNGGTYTTTFRTRVTTVRGAVALRW